MPTAGAFAGRIAEVAISNAVSNDVTTATYVAVEKVKSPGWSGSNDTAESSSNDSAGVKEYVPTWNDATFNFDCVADENATGQEHIMTAFNSGQIRAFRYRPRGDASGERQYRFLGIVKSLDLKTDSGDVAMYTVSVQRTGPFTRDTQ